MSQAVHEEVDGFLGSRKRAFKWEVGVCVRRLRRQELYRHALQVCPLPLLRRFVRPLRFPNHQTLTLIASLATSPTISNPAA